MCVCVSSVECRMAASTVSDSIWSRSSAPSNSATMVRDLLTPRETGAVSFATARVHIYIMDVGTVLLHVLGLPHSYCYTTTKSIELEPTTMAMLLRFTVFAGG